MKLNRIMAVTVCAAVILTLSGCSVKIGSNGDSSSTSSGGTSAAVSNGETKLVTEGLSDDAIIAHPTGEGIENTDALSINYGEIKKEYLYWLQSYGITDDSAESVAENCKTERATIVNYLINERIIMEKAAALGLTTLTEEEQTALEEEYNSQLSEQIAYFAGIADYGTLETGEVISDEEKNQRGGEGLDEYLAECGLTRDDLLLWQRNAVITNKLKDEMTKDVERSEAETRFDEYVETIKNLYETDVSSYESGQYSAFWIPEGARQIKHILIQFDSAITDEIAELRSNGDEEAANALRTEKLANIQEKYEQVLAELEGGADFDELITKYSGDASASATYPDGYLVVPNGVNFMEEFQQTAFELENVGDTGTAVTDYGYHIMLYVADAAVSEDDITSFTDYIYDTIKENSFSTLLAEWKTDYAYEIDYDAIKIDAPAVSQTAESGSSEAE